MSSLKNDIGKWLLESTGRGKPALRYTFSEYEIVSVAYPRDVSSLKGGTYLNLHPTHYAVAIAPDGKIMNLKGGYIPLPPGRYTIHFVDKQNRVMNIPRTGETTYDGCQVALELVITYKVIDPIKALEVQQAVETLQRFIQSDVKEFIRSNKYDDIVGDAEGHKIENDRVAHFIKQQHAGRHQMSRLFLIADVVVREKVGDPKINEIREKYQINQRQFVAQSEIQRQNQELEKKVAVQEAIIKQMKAESDADLQDIIRKMELQRIELDNARSEFQYRQEQWRQAVDAIAQTLSSPSYPQDPQVFGVIRELLNALSGSQVRAQEPASETEVPSPGGSTGTSNSEKIDELTNILLNWQKRTPS